MTGKSSKFIGGLRHNSKIIQLSHLSAESKSDIEKLLSIFNQSRKFLNDLILDIDEKFPKKYRAVIHPLQRACTKEILDNMQGEDDYFEELLDKERLIDEQKQKLIEKDLAMATQAKELAKKIPPRFCGEICVEYKRP